MKHILVALQLINIRIQRALAVLLYIYLSFNGLLGNPKIGDVASIDVDRGWKGKIPDNVLALIICFNAQTNDERAFWLSAADLSTFAEMIMQ